MRRAASFVSFKRFTQGKTITLRIIYLQKFYSRPIGYDNQVSLDKLYLSAGQLVSVTGTVTRVEPSKFSRKITCFKCSMCAALIVVKQKPNSVIQTTPTSCHKGCPARSRFVELLTSPHTITQLKQVVTIRENLYDTDLNKVQNVTLIQDLVNTVIVGMSVTVTGIVKHEHAKPQKFVNPNECKKLKSYLKCFSVEQRHKVSPMSEVSITDQRDVLQMMKAEPSPFRVLVHSLCPSIYGREEVKAGLILALLSGNELMPYRRSESHVLLVGIPGAGKSKLLQFCAEVSTKGMFVSGPTSTGVGLLANVGKKGTVDAGPLVLADGGVCCIDEFDKMASHSHVLLESMEQQVVSIMKCGVLVNMPSRVSIIAAANPVTSFYDRKKTMLQNVKIKTPLMSRFDLIFALETNSRESDDQFLAHINSKDSSAGSSSFFSSSNFSPMTTGKKTGTSWIKQNYKEPVNTLSLPLLKFFIGYARENIKPTLSLEAKVAIKTFYLEMQQANVGPEVQVVTFRQLEALMRLTLARARADLAEIATREHALEVISIMKHSMIDIYPDDDPLDATVSSSGATKRRAENLSSLSKPKQMKAFKEHLENEVELQNRDEFSKAEIKNMAKELGIKDVNEIIDRFNYAQFLLILNTGNGYKVNLHGHLL